MTRFLFIVSLCAILLCTVEAKKAKKSKPSCESCATFTATSYMSMRGTYIDLPVPNRTTCDLLASALASSAKTYAGPDSYPKGAFKCRLVGGVTAKVCEHGCMVPGHMAHGRMGTHMAHGRMGTWAHGRCRMDTVDRSIPLHIYVLYRYGIHDWRMGRALEISQPPQP